MLNEKRHKKRDMVIEERQRIIDGFDPTSRPLSTNFNTISASRASRPTSINLPAIKPGASSITPKGNFNIQFPSTTKNVNTSSIMSPNN